MKIKLGKKVNQYRTDYYKEFGALFGLVFVGFFIYMPAQFNYGVEEYTQPQVNHIRQAAKMVEETVEDKIVKHFPRSHKTMIAIAKAESNMNPNAKNWNCYYNEDETIVYNTKVKGSHSTFCKKTHRVYAWSVDCGILQMNVRSKDCPVETIDEHLEKAAELSRIQGLHAWVAYKNNSYLAYQK